MLKLSHVKKMYGKTEILIDVDFTFQESMIYPVLGGPGSGRTTLFKCISKDLTIDSGVIKTDVKEERFYAAKESVLPMYISGYEFISFLCDLKKREHKPEYYLERVGISSELASELICEYSFEEKKLLQLAAFLVQRPYVIMFDEPFDYCSESYIDAFLDVLEQECEGHIVLISTGDLNVAKMIAKDVLILNNGELNEVTEDMINIPEINHAILDILGDIEE